MNQTTSERKFDPRINSASNDFDTKKIYPKVLWNFLADLHKEFTPRQQILCAKPHRSFKAFARKRFAGLKGNK